MAGISRREFFKKTATDTAMAGLLAAAGGTMLNANPLGLPIGSQTYPHRQMIKDGDFAGLLKTLKDIGVERIELCSPFGYGEFANLSDAGQVKKTLNDHGLQCESAHFSMRELRDNQQKSIDWAAGIGMTQMLVATLGGGGTPRMVDVKRAADVYTAY
jgi:sugar phosphate isomerase/epimerase